MSPATQWVCGGIFVLICGSYGYTTLLAADERNEKRAWRESHSQQVDRRLERMEARQQSLSVLTDKHQLDVRREAEKVDEKLEKINENVLKLLQERPTTAR